MEMKSVKGDFDQVIQGEPASAKNQRRIVKIKGMPRLIKSAKALQYSKSFESQVTQLDPMLVGDLALRLDVWYASRRPDLAAMDLVMDLLQGHVYENDRQIKASMSLWNLDKENPRVRVRIRRIENDVSTGTSSLTLSEIWGLEV